MGKHGSEKENIFPSIVSLTPLSMASSMISCCVLEISLIVIHKTIPVEGWLSTAKPGKRKDTNYVLLILHSPTLPYRK